MGVRAVAEGDALDNAGRLVAGAVRGSVLLPEVATNGVVVLGRHLEGLQRKLAADCLVDVAVSALPRLEELGVIARIGEDGNALVVLRCCAKESDTADVNFLDGIGE